MACVRRLCWIPSPIVNIVPLASKSMLPLHQTLCPSRDDSTTGKQTGMDSPMNWIRRYRTLHQKLRATTPSLIWSRRLLAGIYQEAAEWNIYPVSPMKLPKSTTSMYQCLKRPPFLRKHPPKARASWTTSPRNVGKHGTH